MGSGFNQSPSLASIALTQLRTFNGPALVERCHRAWRNQQAINLEYRASDGLILTAPIVAARFVDTQDGHLLALWVRLPEDEVELELGYDDDNSDEDE